MTVRVLKTARADLTDGYWFYEDQTQVLETIFRPESMKTWPCLEKLPGFIAKRTTDTTR